MTSDTNRVSDGLDYLTVVMTLNDVDSMPLPGKTVAFTSSVDSDVLSIAGVTTSSGITDANGQLIARVRAVAAGTRTIAASLPGTDFSVSAPATFIGERSLPTFLDTGARLPTPRTGLAAAVGNDGQIYAIGGLLADGRVTNVVEALDPKTLSWSTARSMPTARSQLAAVTGIDGRIYAIGGCHGGERPCDLPTVESYDAQAATWSELQPMNVSRAGLAAVSDTLDQILVAVGGGLSPTSAETWALTATGWASPSPLTSDRAFLAAAFGSDGNVYAIGGDVAAGNGLPTDLVEVLSSASNTWSRRQALPTPRELLAAVSAPDGRIYAIGGEACPTSICADTGAVEAYNPKLDLWSPVGPLVVPRSGLAAVVVPSGNLVVLGGSQGSDPVQAQQVEIYGPLLSAQVSDGILTLSGSNFGADANVAIRLGDPEGELMASLTTDATGSFSMTQAIGTGSTTLFAADDRTQYPVNLSVIAP